MWHITRIVKQQFIGVLAFVGLIAAVAAAATGGPVLLGGTNSANKTTVVQNTGPGAVIDLKAKAGEPPLKVNSKKVVTKLNADLLDGKNSTSFAVAGSSYTKGEADAKYLDGTEAYTKAQADAGFLSPSEAYTKTQADAAFLSITGGDARYGRVLFSSTYFGMAAAQQDVTSEAFSGTVPVPGDGIIEVLLWIEPGSSNKCGAQPEIDGVVRGGADNSQGSGSGASAVVGVGAGEVPVRALIRNYADGSSVSCFGRVTVVFFPAP